MFISTHNMELTFALIKISPNSSTAMRCTTFQTLDVKYREKLAFSLHSDQHETVCKMIKSKSSFS